MSSESKNEDQADSDVSRFTLDGVVAEMVIEVDKDNEHSPSKTLKLNGFEKYKQFPTPASKKNCTPLDTKESSVDGSTGTSEGQDPPSENLENLKETNTSGNRAEDIPEENTTAEPMEVEGKSVEDRASKDASQSILIPPKRGRKRKDPQKCVPNIEVELQEDPKPSRSRTRSAVKIVQSKEISADDILKRGNKRNSPNEEKIEVPAKKLRSATEDNSGTVLRRGRKPGKLLARKPEPVQLKRQSLRNATLLKTTSKVIDLKPKVYNLSRDGNTSLSSFDEIKERVGGSEMKSLRYLYRALYGNWPPKDMQEMKNEILQFQGYTFKKKSDEFEKRQYILKKMPDSYTAEICNILGVKEGEKDSMVANIMKFLLKPSKIVICSVDPFHPSMQPVLKVQKITFDNKYLTKVKDKDTSQPSKRKRFPSSKLEIYISDVNSLAPKQRKSVTEKAQVTTSKIGTQEKKKQQPESTIVTKTKISVKEQPSSKIAVKRVIIKAKNQVRGKKSPLVTKQKAPIGRGNVISKPPLKYKNKPRPPQVPVVSSNTLVSSDYKVRRKVLELAIEIQETEKSSEPLMADGNEEYVPLTFEHIPEIKQEPETDEDENLEAVGKENFEVKGKENETECLENEIESVENETESMENDTEGMENETENIEKGGKNSEKEKENFNQEEGNLEKEKDSVQNEREDLGKKKDNLEKDKENSGVEEQGNSEYINTVENIISEENKIEDSSSEVTLSADEMKEQMQNDYLQKKVSNKPLIKPLRTYPSIKGKINKANFSALQRLHILLFGAADKADNLKENILSFGGFPFYDGSEEWKQKEFLLSLLAQNTLKEYLNLLCIKYGDEDQQCLITKLMRFLSAPIERMPVGEKVKTQVVASEPICNAPVPEPKKSVPLKKKVIKKPEEKKKPTRYRKVLMDEAQVRRLEADLAREQRILERERKLNEEQAKRFMITPPTKPLPMKPSTINDVASKMKVALAGNEADAEMLSALLETVYKRRALKQAGAKISIPNKGGHTRLGELANVKFLVVTSNYNDLDVLHHLIYMTEATKGRVRKNILDFAGFNFTEESPAYQDRLDFLTSLGYDISRRIAFLLGLCPYKTHIEQQDLNELIMYFLMSPCQSKQVPIRHLPQTFFQKDMPKAFSDLMEKHSGELSVSPLDVSAYETQSLGNSLEITVSEEPSSQQVATAPRPKAKKSFRSSLPPTQKKGLTPSISTLPLKTPEPLLKSAQSTQLPSISGKPATPISVLQTVQKRILANLPVTSPSATPQEFLIQQQTPDGKQKTYKLIKLPSNHPFNSVLKNQSQQQPVAAPVPISPSPELPKVQTQPLAVNVPVIGAPFPPGIIIFKNNSSHPSLPNVVQTAPLVIGQTEDKIINPIAAPSLPEDKSDADKEEYILPDTSDSTAPEVCNYDDEEAEELDPLDDSSPPTDDELFSSIQEVIHNSNFEDITLRNVIDRVSAQFSAFELTQRHGFMKECVKKIIMGT